jgi:hypothetical protein
MRSSSACRSIIVVLGGAGLVLAAPGVALAGAPESSSPHASSPGRFSYDDALFGPVQCHEVHHPGRIPSGLLKQTPELPQTTAGYDTVSCRIANPFSAGAGQRSLYGWVSDFTRFATNGGVIRATVNADGTHYHGVASYPSG